MARVNAILDDVKEVSAKVKEETERVDLAIHSHDGPRRRYGRSRALERPREDQPDRRVGPRPARRDRRVLHSDAA